MSANMNISFSELNALDVLDFFILLNELKK